MKTLSVNGKVYDITDQKAADKNSKQDTQITRVTPVTVLLDELVTSVQYEELRQAFCDDSRPVLGYVEGAQYPCIGIDNNGWLIFQRSEAELLTTIYLLPNGTVSCAVVKVAEIDDTAVGAEAWSSKNIVDKLCPGFAESGSLVSCEPVEGYPLEVVTHLQGLEDGCTGLSLYRGGKNLSPNVSASMSNTAGSITLADNIFTLNSEGNSSSNIAISYSKTRAFTLPAGTYRLTAEKISGTAAAFSEVYFGLRDTASSWAVETVVYSVDGNAVKTFTFTEPKTVCVCAIANANQGFDSLTYRVQIEIGKVSTAYEEYRGEVFTADFSNHPNVAALYSGTYNWATGVLVDGEEGTVWQHDPDTGKFTQVDEDYQPTVIRSIPALPGVNYLYCDVGTVTVKGRKDPVAILEKQEARLKALETAIINNT